MEIKPSKPFRAMTPDELITDVSLRRFESPLKETADREKAALSDLGILILFLDFDAAVLSGGILGFIENSYGRYLNHTIEMFHRIKASETETVLRGIKTIMDKYGVTTTSLQADCAGIPEYTISSFSQRHGPELDSMADEFEKVPGKLYTENDATEDAYALIGAFVTERFDSIVSQLEKIPA